MSRTLTAAALAKIATAQGIEPINIVEIEFVPGTTINYSDKPSALGVGKIMSLSEVDDIVNLSGSRATTSMSVKLDDHDSVFKHYLDNHDIHNRPVKVFQYFEGLNVGDKFLLFSGRIESPIIWSEQDHTVSFNVVSQIYGGEVGFSPEEGQFASVRDDLVGQVWPLCFGSVIHVPAVEVRDVATGTLLTNFGMPDATLVHKIRLINLYLANITATYVYYYQAQIIALGLVKAPLAIQDEFMDRIILEDQTKQTKEDLTLIYEFHNKEFDRRAKLYQAAQYDTIAQAAAKGKPPENSREHWHTKLKEQREIRQTIYNQIILASQNLDTLKILKEMSEIDADNAKYVFDFVGDLREKMIKLIEQYHKLQNDLIDHQVAYLQQTTLWANQLLIDQGYTFPQETIVIINIDNHLLEGFFSGNIFTITNRLPTYRSYTLADRQNDNPANFWLPDGNTNLQGMYALTDTGHIIKISSQDGAMCTIDLITKEDSEREKTTFLDNTPEHLSQIKTALDHLLTGNETPEQLLQIASEVPKDLSRYAWNKLQGTLFNTQVLTGKYLGGGTFTLTYDEYESAPIPYNVSADDLKIFILNFPPFQHMPSDTDKLEVTGGPLHEDDIVIVFRTDLWKDPDDPNPKVMFPLIVNQSELTGTVARQRIRPKAVGFVGAGALAQYTLIGPDAHAQVKYSDDVAAFKPKANGVKSSADFTVRGSSAYSTMPPLNPDAHYPSGELEIEIIKGDPFTINDSNNKVELINETKNPMLWAYRASDGAREYTVNEQARLLFDEFEKDVNYPALSELKKQMVKLFKAMNDPSNQATRQEIQQMLAGKLSLYINQARYIHIPEKVIEEAFRLISDQEYKLLFEMELLHYIDWKRSIRPITSEVEFDTESYYYTALNFTTLLEVAPAILPSWLATLPSYSNSLFMTAMRSLPENEVLSFDVGAKVTLVGNFQQKYVANIIPSTVHAVHAYRNINGVELLVPVPTSYYIKKEADTAYNPLETTTITLVQPLSRYSGENWKEGIYVTLTSAVGPNTVDIMEWVIGHYTNLTVDSSSFNSVKSALTNYPSHFALFEKKNALQLLEDLAWQSRCAFWVNGNVAHLRYLSVVPNSVHTLDDSNVKQGSLQLTFTPIENLVTRLTCQWQPHYALKNPYQLVLRHNLAKYPEIGEDVDFYIYTHRELVLKSATFWLIRKANIWKKCRLSVALDSMVVETLDCVLIAFATPYFANVDVKGIVESAKLNTETDSIDMDVWLPVKAGTMEVYDFAWPSSVTVNDIFPEVDLIISGNAGSGFNSKVPKGINYDPTDPDQLAFRPKDYGDIKPSDDSDTPPTNTALEFTEQNYKLENGPKLQSPKMENTLERGKDPRYEQSGFTQKVNEQVERAVGKQAHFVGYGRVLGKSSTGRSLTYTNAEGNTQQGELQYYDVRLNSGRTVQVNLLGRLSDGEQLPAEMLVLVSYEGSMGEYVMAVPTDLGGEALNVKTT